MCRGTKHSTILGVFRQPLAGFFYAWPAIRRINSDSNPPPMGSRTIAFVALTVTCSDSNPLSIGSRTRAVVAFNPNQWSNWYKEDPKLANLELRHPRKRLVKDSQKFLDTGGDVYYLLKSDVQGELEKVLDYIQEKMKDFCDNFDVTKSQPPSKVRFQWSNHWFYWCWIYFWPRGKGGRVAGGLAV